jgi:large subunit ribosomal protein L1
LDDLIEEITKGFLGFDVAVASPDVMKNLGKVAKILGTKV